MINNLHCTEEYSSSRGWIRVVQWECNGTKNYVECKNSEHYIELTKALGNSQIDKKVPYSRVIYVRNKK